MRGSLIDNIYCLDTGPTLLSAQTYLATSLGLSIVSNGVNSMDIWDVRFGHIHDGIILDMAWSNTVKGLHLTDSTNHHDFGTGCALGKSARCSYPQHEPQQHRDRPGLLIHSDLCGPMKNRSLGGVKYFLLFKDEHFGYHFFWIS